MCIRLSLNSRPHACLGETGKRSLLCTDSYNKSALQELLYESIRYLHTEEFLWIRGIREGSIIEAWQLFLHARIAVCTYP